MSEPTISEELTRLAQLRDQGILTEQEFQVQKNRLLNRTPNTPSPLEPERSRLPALIALIAVGLLVLIGLAVFALNPHKQTETTASAPPATSTPVNEATSQPGYVEPKIAQQAAQEAADTQALQQAQARLAQANNRLSQIWQMLPDDVQSALTQEQNIFSRTVATHCAQQAADRANNQTQQQTFDLNCRADATENRINALQNAAAEIQPQLQANRLEEAQSANAAAMNEFTSLNDRLPDTVKQQLQSDLQTWLANTQNRCAGKVGSNSTDSAIASLSCMTQALKRKNQELKGYII